MSTDLSEFEAFARRQGPSCGVAVALGAMTKTDAAKLNGALGAPHIAGTTIARWLKGHGHPVRDYTVLRHRNGECSCG